MSFRPEGNVDKVPGILREYLRSQNAQLDCWVAKFTVSKDLELMNSSSNSKPVSPDTQSALAAEHFGSSQAHQKYRIAHLALYLALGSIAFGLLDWNTIRWLSDIDFRLDFVALATILLMSSIFLVRDLAPQSKAKRLWASGIALLLLVFYAVPIVLGQKATISFTKEDGLVEWVGARGLLGASIAMFSFSWRNRRKHFLSAFTRVNPAAFILALVFFFGFGEDISWGQRVIGLETPEALKEVNHQDEFNVHNLRFTEVDSDGEVVRIWDVKSIIHILFDLFAFMFCLAIPTLSAASKQFSDIMRYFGIPIAPMWMGVFFIANYIGPFVLYFHTPDAIHHGLRELGETNVSLILLSVSIILAQSFGNSRGLRS